MHTKAVNVRVEIELNSIGVCRLPIFNEISIVYFVHARTIAFLNIFNFIVEQELC